MLVLLFILIFANLGVASMPIRSFQHLKNWAFRSGIPSLFRLDGTVHSSKYGFTFKKFSPLLETFNEMTGRFLDYGLLNENSEYIRQFEASDNLGPQVLTMEHLKLGFAACLITLGFATVVFFIEVFVPKKENKKCQFLVKEKTKYLLK